MLCLWTISIETPFFHLGQSNEIRVAEQLFHQSKNMTMGFLRR